MFVPLPTCGIFYRHANGLVFNRVDIQPQKSDPRPARVFSDVQDVTMDGSPVSASVIRSTSVSGAMKTYPAIESSGYHHVKNA